VVGFQHTMCVRPARAEESGEGGIRTLETLITSARFPSECLQPLDHLSIISMPLRGTAHAVLGNFASPSRVKPSTVGGGRGRVLRRQEGGELVDGERAAEQVALGVFAAAVGEEVGLVLGLDALRLHRKPERVRHRDDR
jgi:hypothetical protein